jgi:hypothetical protein
MPLDMLNKFDPLTANSVLAAAALSTSPSPGIGDESEFVKYATDAAAVLAEIRRNLNLKEDDNSTAARARIDSVLSDAFDQSIFRGSNAEAALSRAGNAGRLSPGAYQIVQPGTFRNVFYHLAVTKQQVKEAVHEPDDYQHLMHENALPGEDDLFSIFMKQSGGSRTRHAANWLLITSLRRGIEQVVQSAWRIYPDDVDLAHAAEPLHVLAAFAEVFGAYVNVAGRRAKFIESVTLPKDPSIDQLSYTVQLERPPQSEHFSSWSYRKTTSNNSFNFGLVFSIDLPPYRDSLRRHGAI